MSDIACFEQLPVCMRPMYLLTRSSILTYGAEFGIWIARLMHVLDLAHERVSVVCDQPDGFGRTDHVGCIVRRGYVNNRRLALTQLAKYLPVTH